MADAKLFAALYVLRLAKHYHGLEPLDMTFGRLVVEGVWLREIVVSRPGLVRYVAAESLFVDKVAHPVAHVGYVAAAVVAHVDDKPVGVFHGNQHHVDEAVRGRAREGGINIRIPPFGLRDTCICGAGAGVIVEAEIILLNDAQVEVLRIVAPPLAVVAYVEPRRQVGVAVAKFLKHGGAVVEELYLSPVGLYGGTIAGAYFVPVHIFIFEEAVVFVEDSPECIEVAVVVVVPLFDAVA